MNVPGNRINVGGRPKLNPADRLSVNVRAVITGRVRSVLSKLVVKKRMVVSDVLRVALYELIISEAKDDPTILGNLSIEDLRNEPTFSSLVKKGLI